MSTVGEWTALGAARHELGEGARATDHGFVFVDLLAGVLFETDGEPAIGTDDTPAIGPGGKRTGRAGGKRSLGAGASSARERLRLDIPLGAVAPHAGGGWIAAAGTGIALLDDSDGAAAGDGIEVEWLARPFDDSPVPMRMNDGVVDPHGRFWAGAMPYDGTPGAGRLVRVDPDGGVQAVLGGLTVPNGPAFSLDGATMYLADSARGVILQFRVEEDGGIDEPAAVFTTVDDASPDGMTVDADGYVWSALWGGSRLHRYSPDGELVDVVPVPAVQPTSIAFSACAPYRVLVTTATHGLTEPGSLDGATLVASTTVAGLPTATFGA
ncbi:SMP-30/gluconolactonase/LRE family protein [Nocardia carnea]|uniref:SMP-30/gluconolactonase/LRE family protein n=1 Tax=Nocardia carnea TaxID=37328 RepID=UPI0024583872|nr:SMP-30/gluconolactonase/LRE family protein [Nocardia carnea]